MPTINAPAYLIVAISDRGRRCGEGHPKARLSDAQVDEMRDLNEGGWGYKRLAARFQVPVGTVADICTYTRRVAIVAGAKRINLLKRVTA